MKNLKQMAFFADFNDEDMKRLSLISKTKNYYKGETLFYEGDEPKYLYVLLEGFLKIYKTDYKSHQIFLHQFSPITFVAELTCFENIPYPASSEFVTDGKVLKIEYQKFKDDFMSSPDISFKVIKSLTGKLKIMSQVLHQETVLTSEGKVAKFIVENGELFGSIKQVKIASILNLTPETLSRILSKFRQNNFVEFNEEYHLDFYNQEKLKEFYE